MNEHGSSKTASQGPYGNKIPESFKPKLKSNLEFCSGIRNLRYVLQLESPWHYFKKVMVCPFLMGSGKGSPQPQLITSHDIKRLGEGRGRVSKGKA